MHVPKSTKIKGLERGVKVSGTALFRPNLGDRRDVVIAATGAAEGGYDTVNMYDKGILSWGMMQWTLHSGSLQNALAFIKKRLAGQGRSSLWSELFGGLDVRDNQIIYRGELVTTKNNRRLCEIFRGSPTPDEYNREEAAHWAGLFARAGRHPVIQALQTEYARKEVDELLARNLGEALAGLKKACATKPRGGTWDYVCPRLPESSEFYRSRYRGVSEYVGRVLKAIILFFGVKVNNPAGAFLHLKQAIDALASKHGTHDVERWPAGWEAVLGDELERILLGSTFAMWGDAKAKRAGRISRTEKMMTKFKELTAV